MMTNELFHLYNYAYDRFILFNTVMLFNSIWFKCTFSKNKTLTFTCRLYFWKQFSSWEAGNVCMVCFFSFRKKKDNTSLGSIFSFILTCNQTNQKGFKCVQNKLNEWQKINSLIVSYILIFIWYTMWASSFKHALIINIPAKIR